MTDNRTKAARGLDEILGLIDNLPSGENPADGEETKNLPRLTIDPVSVEPVDSAVQISSDLTGMDRDQVEDYIFSRTISRRLIEKGLGALELAMVLAKESEHPKAFDSINNLLNTIGQLNKDLVAMHKKPAGNQQKAKVIHNTQNNINVPANDPKEINNILDGLSDINPVNVKDVEDGSKDDSTV